MKMSKIRTKYTGSLEKYRQCLTIDSEDETTIHQKEKVESF